MISLVSFEICRLLKVKVVNYQKALSDLVDPILRIIIFDQKYHFPETVALVQARTDLKRFGSWSGRLYKAPGKLITTDLCYSTINGENTYYLDTYIYHALDKFSFALCMLLYESEACKYAMSCFYFPENPSAFPFERPPLQVEVFHLPPIITYTFDSVHTDRSCSHLITTEEDFLSCLNTSSLLRFLKFNSSLLKSCYITYFFLQYEVTKCIIEKLMAVFN